jgi:WD40 repeat protein
MGGGNTQPTCKNERINRKQYDSLALTLRHARATFFIASDIGAGFDRRLSLRKADELLFRGVLSARDLGVLDLPTRIRVWLRGVATGFALVLAIALPARADDAKPGPGVTLVRQLHEACTIVSLAYSPDGSRIAVGDKCGVKLREAANGALISAFRLTTIEVPAVAFTPNGKEIVEVDDYVSEFADSPSGYGGVIDLASGKRTELALGDYGSPQGQTVALSPDGKTVVVVANDGGARLYRHADGAALSTLAAPAVQGDAAQVQAKDAKFAPDGGSVAALYDDGAIRFFDPGSGALERTVKSSSPLDAFAFLGPDALLTLERDGRAHVLGLGKVSPATLEEAAAGAPTDNDNPVSGGVAISSDGGVLIAWSQGFGMRAWARGGGKPIWRLPLEPSGPIAVSPDISEFATSDGATIKVFALPDGKLKYAKAPGAPFRAVRFEADAAAFSAFDADGIVRRWDAASGRLLSQKSLAAEGSMSAFDGRLAVVADADKGAEVFDAALGNKLATIKGASTILALALAPNDRALALADRETAKGSDTTHAVTLYSLPGGKVLKIFAGDANNPQALAFSADGKALIVGYAPSGVTIIDVATGKVLAKTETADKGDIYGVHGLLAFASGHSYAVRNDFALQLRGFPASKRFAVFKAPYDLNAFDVSKDGNRIAIAADPVELWSPNGHKPDRTLPTDGDDVDALAFSPDGKRLLIGDAGGEIRLFDVADGALLASFYALGADWAAMAPDGKFVASGDVGQFVRPARAGVLQPIEDFVKANHSDRLH